MVHTGGVMQILQSVMLRVFWCCFSMFVFRLGWDTYNQAEFGRRDVSDAISKRESSYLVLPRSCLISILISSSGLFS